MEGKDKMKKGNEIRQNAEDRGLVIEWLETAIEKLKEGDEETATRAVEWAYRRLVGKKMDELEVRK